MQFNILVTTYETIMRDRTKLSKLEWKYIIIDEAQARDDRGHTIHVPFVFLLGRRLLLRLNLRWLQPSRQLPMMQ